MADQIPGNTTPPAPDNSWFAGFDDTTKAHMTAKGYDKLEAPAAFLAAHQAYQGAESKLGIPADRVLRVPDATDSAAWNDVWAKLGKPADAAGYDLSGVKDAKGAPLPETTANWIRENALKLNLPAAAAVGLAAALHDRDVTTASTKQVANSAVLAAEQADLDMAWGGNKVRNEFLVTRAAAMLGFNLDEIRQEPGFSTKMKNFLNVATKIGEADLVGGEGGGGSIGGRRALSPEEAVSRLDDIKQGRDKDFGRRYFRGNPAEKAEAGAEWKALTELAARRKMGS